MSLIRSLIRIYRDIVPRHVDVTRLCVLATPKRCLQLSALRFQDADEGVGEKDDESPKLVQRPVVDVETSIRYLESKAYQITYRGAHVWEPYRRNHKGAIPPSKTRKLCIRGGQIATGNPCPICRDEYLVLHPANTKLLKQFISPHTGEVLSYQKTGICQKQHLNLLVAVQQAWDKGTIEMTLPFRQYDYTDYYPDWKPDTEKKI